MIILIRSVFFFLFSHCNNVRTRFIPFSCKLCARFFFLFIHSAFGLFIFALLTCSIVFYWSIERWFSMRIQNFSFFFAYFSIHFFVSLIFGRLVFLFSVEKKNGFAQSLLLRWICSFVRFVGYFCLRLLDLISIVFASSTSFRFLHNHFEQNK